ncbi:MAG: ExeA family protein [Betaproteobacteria bacterium]
MYESWFGFQEKPFNLTPDPKYLYLSPKHAEAFAHLEFGRRERGGFIVITGEVGTGKTTLARHFLARLGPDTRTAVVLYPALTAAELLGAILQDLHVTAEGPSLKSLVDALHRFLLESRAAGRNVVLLIDEAQDLSPEVLEQVRLLSNLETDTEKLIQIILIGQSELRALLARHELRQLAQRVTAHYHLSALDPADTAEYVRHRLAVAGGEGKVTFTSQALRLVHRRCGGVPRLINLVCDRALLAGFVASSRTIDAGMVEQASREALAATAGRPLAWRHGLVGSALTVGLALFAFALWPRAARAPSGGGTPLAVSSLDRPATSAALAAPSPSARLDAFLRSAGREASFAQAIAQIGRVWQGRPLSRTTLRTHLGQLRALDLPAVLEMFHPSRRDTCFVALLGLGEHDALVAAGEEQTERVPLAQVESLWTRDAVLAWPEDDSLRDDPARQSAWARGVLAEQGYTEADLGAALRRFQGDVQLVSDGLLGPRTRMALFARATPEHPRLSTGGARP